MIKGSVTPGDIVKGKKFRGEGVVISTVGARAHIFTEHWKHFSDCHLAELTMVTPVAEQTAVATEVVAPECCVACGRPL